MTVDWEKMKLGTVCVLLINLIKFVHVWLCQINKVMLIKMKNQMALELGRCCTELLTEGSLELNPDGTCTVLPPPILFPAIE